MIHLDTTLLVDLLRESRADRATSGPQIESLPAHRFLLRHPEEHMVVSAFTVCELMAGAACAGNPERERTAVESIVSGLAVAFPGVGFASVYAELFAELGARGETIPAFDLLIGTSALVDDAPLVTRNTFDFERIPGLKVLSY